MQALAAGSGRGSPLPSEQRGVVGYSIRVQLIGFKRGLQSRGANIRDEAAVEDVFSIELLIP